MKANQPKEHKNQKRAASVNSAERNQNHSQSTFQFADNRAKTIVQRKLQETANNSHRVRQTSQLQAMANHYVSHQHPIQKKENKTGLPDQLKSGMESLSGYSMDDVKVHYNSDKPSQLQAHAYAQGTDIHLASGQEKHLPHEAWHVVQQKQGRVKPTMQLKGKVNVNNDVGLEKEADLMGDLMMKTADSTTAQKKNQKYTSNEPTAQRTIDNRLAGHANVAWAAIRDRVMESPIFQWANDSNLINIVLQEKAGRDEEGADAYGTTDLQFLDHPVSPGAILRNPGMMARLINGARADATQRPIFTINVAIYTNALEGETEDPMVTGLDNPQKHYLTLAHEIGVHVAPKVAILHSLLNQARITGVQVMKMLVSIESEHPKSAPRDGRPPENPVYMTLIARETGASMDSPLMHSFLFDVARYHGHDNPILMTLLAQKLMTEQIAEFLQKAKLPAAAAIAMIILAIFIYKLL